MKLMAACTVAATFLILVPATGAQTRSAEGMSARGVVSLGVQAMSAADSFDAVAGTSSLGQFGGGVQVVNLWRSLFVEVTIERSRADGARVFVNDGQVFPLGIPLRVTATPVDILAGWRFRGLSRVVPYGGGGLTSVAYREASDFSDGDDVEERGTGAVAFGGVEVPVWRWIHVRGELRFRHVPGVFGDSGVSAAFGETSLGGLSYGVKIAVGR